MLQGAALPTAGAVDIAAATSTALLWDDAVQDVKTATRELEDQVHSYERAVKGFVRGIDGLSELVLALQSMPEASLPRAPGPQINRASTQLPSCQSTSIAETATSAAGGRLCMPHLTPVSMRLEEPGNTGAGDGLVANSLASTSGPVSAPPSSPEEPDSGSRLFQNLTKMGQARALLCHACHLHRTHMCLTRCNLAVLRMWLSPLHVVDAGDVGWIWLQPRSERRCCGL